jgi:enamine deaminase RidA (YjgF/YER057c/UK114 family)
MQAVLQSAAPLHLLRRPAAQAMALVPQALGALAYGDLPGIPQVHARVLSPNGPQVDLWTSEGPFTDGRTGCVHWRHNGRWLFGTLELHEGVDAAGLEALAHRAYTDIFATLRTTGCTQLQRLWNYLPRINADGGGLERYRQFNTGRQVAFLEAGVAAFEGAPAACALGTHTGPFCVHFLAGTEPPVPVENPRQVSAYRYPSAYGPRAPTFSRAALVKLSGRHTALLISGTASIVGHASVHPGDVVAQTRETLANLQAVIAAAHQHTVARFALADMDCTIYVRHAADLPLIRQVFDAAVGPASHAARAAVALEGDICRSDLLVEIEGHCVAEHGAHA